MCGYDEETTIIDVLTTAIMLILIAIGVVVAIKKTAEKPKPANVNNVDAVVTGLIYSSGNGSTVNVYCEEYDITATLETEQSVPVKIGDKCKTDLQLLKNNDDKIVDCVVIRMHIAE